MANQLTSAYHLADPLQRVGDHQVGDRQKPVHERPPVVDPGVGFEADKARWIRHGAPASSSARDRMHVHRACLGSFVQTSSRSHGVGEGRAEVRPDDPDSTVSTLTHCALSTRSPTDGCWWRFSRIDAAGCVRRRGVDVLRSFGLSNIVRMRTYGRRLSIPRSSGVHAVASSPHPESLDRLVRFHRDDDGGPDGDDAQPRGDVDGRPVARTGWREVQGRDVDATAAAVAANRNGFDRG